MMEIAASLLGADLLYLEEDVREAEKWGLRILHFDQMDGHFVHNIAFGPAFVSAVRSITDCFIDVHLMLSDPGSFVDEYVKAGADSITVHAEIDADIDALLDTIHAKGCKTGISINPGTSPESIRRYLPKVDMVLVMMVEPGFGGQALREDCLHKLPILRKIIEEEGRDIPIEVDGGIKLENVKLLLESGADILVMGTGLYGAEDPDAVIEELKEEQRAHTDRLGW